MKRVVQQSEIKVVSTLFEDGTIAYDGGGRVVGVPGDMHPLAVMASLNEYCATLMKQQLMAISQKQVVVATQGMVPQ